MNSRTARVLRAAFNILEYLQVRNSFNCLWSTIAPEK
jgi:hypothetical protein